LLVSLPFFSSGQTGEIETLSLGVEKVSDYEKVIFVFKEGKNLKIKTRDGSKIYSNHYNIYEEFIVVNYTDTILFEDIQMIKGKVYGDSGRKILGIVITGYGIVGGFLGVGAMHIIYGGAAWLLVAIPFSGITVGGINLAGARRFKSNR
jgi:hypothetical protein